MLTKDKVLEEIPHDCIVPQTFFIAYQEEKVKKAMGDYAQPAIDVIQDIDMILDNADFPDKYKLKQIGEKVEAFLNSLTQ